MNFRRLHRKISLILIPFLTVTALTGLVYRVGRNWFGMSNETGAVVRSIHEGKYLGEVLMPFYVLLAGLGLLVLIGSGLPMLRRKSPVDQSRSVRWRWLHRVAAIVLSLPLAATALTGIGFRLTQSWFGWTKQEAQWLMDIHQGTLLFGKDHRIYYVLFTGLGLLALIATGIKLSNWFRKKSA